MPRYTYALTALRHKRARLAGEIEQAERAIAKQREALATVDAVMRLFEPTSNPELIPAIRPSSPGLFFRHGEHIRLCLDALREMAGPRTARHVAEYAMLVKGLPVEDRAIVSAIAQQTRVALRRLEKRGKVRRILREPDVWWELVGGTGA